MYQLKSDIERLLKCHKKIFCKSLRRHVSLNKLPKAITARKDSRRRLRALAVALDIVRHAPSCKIKMIDKHRCYELRGYDVDGALVIVHLREEIIAKDRILFLVSCATK